jgi:protein SCO1/2
MSVELRFRTRAALSVGMMTVLLCHAGTCAELQNVLQDVGFDQKLNMQVPLNLHFLNEDGKDVELGDYFHVGKPVVLLLGYYGCPMLCTQMLNGLSGSMKAIPLKPGNDFEIVMISVDPAEGPAEASAKKKAYVSSGDATMEGWHFLTGQSAAITTAAESTGFRYARVPGGRQFAHASGIMVLTPQGRVSKYFLGIEFPPRDLRLALVEAAQSRIGSFTDKVLLLCYQYDPRTGKYSFAIIQAIRIAGVLTVAALAGFVVLSLLRERTRQRERVA